MLHGLVSWALLITEHVCHASIFLGNIDTQAGTVVRASFPEGSATGMKDMEKFLNFTEPSPLRHPDQLFSLFDTDLSHDLFKV